MSNPNTSPKQGYSVTAFFSERRSPKFNYTALLEKMTKRRKYWDQTMQTGYQKMEQFLPSFPLRNVLNLPDVEDAPLQSMKKERIAGSGFSRKFD